MTRSARQEKLYTVIFESDTRAGRFFDLTLLLAIVLSVGVTMLDSMESVRLRYGRELLVLEWGFTLLFALEYVFRLYAAHQRARYARSFFGVVDFLGWFPTVLGLVVPGSHYLTTFRILRVLRIFRILKLASYLKESEALVAALAGSRRKILIFLFAVLTLVMILGSLMYLIEGPERGFTSIPVSIYWAIVTLTTVGYGDISPQTPPGQFLSSAVMILGYAIIAVPTGIVSAEFLRQEDPPGEPGHCPACPVSRHPAGAKYCHACGAALRNAETEMNDEG